MQRKQIKTLRSPSQSNPPWESAPFRTCTCPLLTTLHLNMRSTTPVRGFRQGKQTTTESDRPPEWTVCYLSKHAGSDPEALGLWPVYGHYGQRAARFGPDSIIMPDLTSHICFSSIFPKKAWIILCKTDPDPIWTAWPGFGQMPLVWKQAGEQDSSGPVSGRTQLACYQFPTFRVGSVLPQTSWIILCKTSANPI